MPHTEQNKSLKKYNTFGLDVTADYFTSIHSIEDLMHVLQDKQYATMPKMFLGGGSNVLLTKDYRGLIIHNCLNGIEVVKRDDAFVYVKSASEEGWHDFILYCIDK